MKKTNGKILILFGTIHSLLGISPFAFGGQFIGFAHRFFFKISEGLYEFPLFKGEMDYASFAAFWFFYFGLLLIPLGILLNHIEKTNDQVPKTFSWTYLIIVLVGVYMIPFSGMTFLMLPHALFMLLQHKSYGKKVMEEQTELNSNLKKLLPKIDFSDTFSTTNHVDNIEEITNLIFNSPPAWIEFLFRLRNKIAGLFGLKTQIPDDYNEDYKVGGYIKFFKIFSISENKVVLGADDSHLKFRAIVDNDKSDLNNIKVITLVMYNNRKGKIYMATIKPFHKLIVKRMVKNASK